MATTDNLLQLELRAEAAINRYFSANADASRPDTEVCQLHTEAIEAFELLQEGQRLNPDYQLFFGAPVISLFAAQEYVDERLVVPTTTPEDISELQEAWRNAVLSSGLAQTHAEVAEEERAATVVEFQQQERAYHSDAPTAEEVAAEAAALEREERYLSLRAARGRNSGPDI